MSLLSRTVARLPQPPLPGVTWAARRWMGRSFGPPPVDADGPAGDLGLLGPGSASWQLYADGAAIVGGIRSLLVQLTHPLAMAGVAEHSRYLSDPLGRLRDTSAYVGVTTFGATDNALAMIRRVRAIHRRVRGVAPDGRPYAADDPELLTWVSVAGTASWLRADRDFGTDPLDPARADAFVAEQARIAALLDPRVDLDVLDTSPEPDAALRSGVVALPLIEEGWLPTTVAELDARMEWFAPRLCVGPYGRQTLRFLLWPPIEPGLRLGYLPTLIGAIGSLDQETRDLIGIPLPGPVAAAARLNGELGLVALRTALARPSPNAVAAARRTREPRSIDRGRGARGRNRFSRARRVRGA